LLFQTLKGPERKVAPMIRPIWVPSSGDRVVRTVRHRSCPILAKYTRLLCLLCLMIPPAFAGKGPIICPEGWIIGSTSNNGGCTRPPGWNGLGPLCPDGFPLTTLANGTQVCAIPGPAPTPPKQEQAKTLPFQKTSSFPLAALIVAGGTVVAVFLTLVTLAALIWKGRSAQ
jgi:hypothetical protein